MMDILMAALAAAAFFAAAGYIAICANLVRPAGDQGE
jgi:hypothetical protein